MITFRGYAGEIKQWKVDKYFDVKLDDRPGIYGVMSLDEDQNELRNYKNFPIWTNKNEKIGLVQNEYFDSIPKTEIVCVLMDEAVLKRAFVNSFDIDEYIINGDPIEELYRPFYFLPVMMEGEITIEEVELKKSNSPNGDRWYSDVSFYEHSNLGFDPETHLNFPNAEPLPENFYWFGPYIIQGFQNSDGDWEFYLPHENIGFLQKPISRPFMEKRVEPIEWYSDTLQF